MTRSYGKIASARSVLTTGEERDNFRDVQPAAVGGGEHCLVTSEADTARSSVTSPTLSTTGIRRGYGRTVSRRPKSGWSSVTVKKKRMAETAPLNVQRLHAAGAIGYAFAYVIHDAYVSGSRRRPRLRQIGPIKARLRLVVSAPFGRSLDRRACHGSGQRQLLGPPVFNSEDLNVVSSPEVGGDR